MGFIRKVASVSTVGMINFRGKNERANKYAKQTRNAARVQVGQNAAQLELQRQQLAALDHGNVREEVRDIRYPQQPQLPPAGWYPNPEDPAVVRWFDGTRWTDFTQPRA